MFQPTNAHIKQTSIPLMMVGLSLGSPYSRSLEAPAILVPFTHAILIINKCIKNKKLLKENQNIYSLRVWYAV